MTGVERAVVLAILGVTVLVGGGFYFLLPRIARRGLLFGVYVGESISMGEAARQITRSWYRWMALWLAGTALLGALLLALAHPVAAMIVAPLFMSLGYLVEYLRAYFRARKLLPAGTPAPPPAAAVIAPIQPRSNILPGIAILVGLLGGIVAIAYCASNYGALPEKVPTHFGISGRPDAWRAKSFWTVMLLPLMTLVTGTGIGILSLLVSRAKRAIRADAGLSWRAQERFRTIMSGFLALITILVTAMLSLGSISSVRVGLGRAEAIHPALLAIGIALFLVATGGSIWIALRVGQGGSKLEKGAAESPLTDGLADNRSWVLGMFYVDRGDPSWFVEHRFGLGYTINFGNWKAVAFFAGFLALILACVVIAFLTN